MEECKITQRDAGTLGFIPVGTSPQTGFGAPVSTLSTGVRGPVRAASPAASPGFPEGPPTRVPGGTVCRPCPGPCADWLLSGAKGAPCLEPGSSPSKSLALVQKAWLCSVLGAHHGQQHVRAEAVARGLSILRGGQKPRVLTPQALLQEGRGCFSHGLSPGRSVRCAAGRGCQRYH